LAKILKNPHFFLVKNGSKTGKKRHFCQKVKKHTIFCKNARFLPKNHRKFWGQKNAIFLAKTAHLLFILRNFPIFQKKQKTQKK